ncbi:proline-rich receptor-like protein kinase PERK2 [Prionailurus bengalensis]|uniref:proline-rich receptor-like protein kinase PERK2 n=1 Tax=Prionailurus bengalensis TaxID=37029 RepID=UPI001CA95802|nr:proline-rich receptor-like protein kinase PERK2 [Prionailurus bengalensis]
MHLAKDISTTTSYSPVHTNTTHNPSCLRPNLLPYPSPTTQSPLPPHPHRFRQMTASPSGPLPVLPQSLRRALGPETEGHRCGQLLARTPGQPSPIPCTPWSPGPGLTWLPPHRRKPPTQATLLAASLHLERPTWQAALDQRPLTKATTPKTPEEGGFTSTQAGPGSVDKYA